MNKKVILDASALLAFLQDETGTEQITQYLSNCCMSTVNVAEVLAILQRQGVPTDEAKKIISLLISDVRSFDLQHAYESSQLYLLNRDFGLSLGDRACLALSLITSFPVVTADKIWQKLHFKNEIILIR